MRNEPESKKESDNRIDLFSFINQMCDLEPWQELWLRKYIDYMDRKEESQKQIIKPEIIGKGYKANSILIDEFVFENT